MLGDHPDGGPVTLKAGRYGPYVQHGKVNATLPKEADPTTLSLEAAVALLNARASAGGGPVQGRLLGEHPSGGPSPCAGPLRPLRQPRQDQRDADARHVAGQPHARRSDPPRRGPGRRRSQEEGCGQGRARARNAQRRAAKPAAKKARNQEDAGQTCRQRRRDQLEQEPRGARRPPTLPSREDILAFIARERDAAGERAPPARIGKREIARAFGITGSDKIGLKRVLKELEDDGALARRRKGLTKADRLAPVVLAEIFSRDRDGDLLAKPCEWDEARGPAPTIVIETPRRPRPGTPVPGLGDRALVRTEPNADASGTEPAYTGRVVKLLDKVRAQVLGRLPQPAGRRRPDLAGRQEGLAQGRLRRARRRRRPGRRRRPRDGRAAARRDASACRGQGAERVGAFGSEKAVSLIAIHAHDIPNVFRPETLAEAEAARPLGLAGREDWRDLPLVTIDPPTPRTTTTPSTPPRRRPGNPGGFVLTRGDRRRRRLRRPRSALDREALERGNSVYFPDRVVPMLPERISNDLCSLRPQEDRPALAMRMVIGADGAKLRHSVHRVTHALGRQALLPARAGRHRRRARRRRRRRCSTPCCARSRPPTPP